MSALRKTEILSRIITAALPAIECAGLEIRSILEQGDLNTLEKTGKNDLQTKADRTSQQILVGAFETRFPGRKFKIGAEEGDIGKVQCAPEPCSQLRNVLANCPTFAELYDNVSEEDITIWIDPLDATKEYTEGRTNPELLQHVTVLVGVAVGASPAAGLIHQPFFGNTQQGANFEVGRTIVGVVNVGAYECRKQVTSSTREIQAFKPSTPPKGFMIATSRSHMDPDTQALVDALEPTKMLNLGGAGYKVLSVIEGLAHAYVFAGPFTKKWDTCAPEAVLRTLGGQLTDLHGVAYPYNLMDDVNTANYGGIIAVTSSIDPRFVTAKAETIGILPRMTKDYFLKRLEKARHK